jgi:N-acetylglutamate synthase-like GNAT family acetyltransferase
MKKRPPLMVSLSNPERGPLILSLSKDFFISRARSDEAEHLTALAVRSKAYWGYDSAFLQACVPALTISSERLAAEPFYVLEDEEGQVVAYAGLRVEGHEAELTNLFVEPWAIGRHYGMRLWQHAIKVARSLGAEHMRIESDPFAEAFYRAMGAERIGEAPSEAIAGRMIPLLKYILPRAEEVAQEGNG